MAEHNLEHHGEHEHHQGIPTYLVVFGVLMVLTIATYLTALRDLDGLIFRGANTILALTIAFIKASLVVWFFMHVKFSSKLVKLSVGAGLFWLAIMFVLTLADYNSRTSAINTY
jgi:cytochrome c oxidase subunit IV